MYDVFISYPHSDAPMDQTGKRWVTSFEKALIAHHHHQFGRKLNVFCDTEIQNGARWQLAIQKAIRQSKIFIAILSENYLKSEWCVRELEEYVRREHALARSGKGIRPVYFMTVPELEPGAAILPDKRLAALIAQLQARQRDLETDWRKWALEGPKALMRLDAEKRLHELVISQAGLDDIFPGLRALDQAVARGLDDAALAELADQLTNVKATYAHFVGRSEELAEIHENLTGNQVQVVTALHGLGGQGKTAIARQYAHAYAGYYAAGGRWEVGCEGRDNLAAIFDVVVDEILRCPHGQPGDPDYQRFEHLKPTEQERALPDDDRLALHLRRLSDFTQSDWQGRLARWKAQVGLRQADDDWVAIKEPRMLVVLDNVDKAKLLSATALAGLARPHWLEVLVTTRLGAQHDLVAGDRIKTMAVRELPMGDAVALLDTLKPIDEHEMAAARELVAFLGQHTLSVELSGAYAAASGLSYEGLLQRFRAEGLTSLDTLGQDPKTEQIVRHQTRQIGMIIAQTIADLSALEKDVLYFAAHFPPDEIREDWLKAVTAKRHTELESPPKPGYPDPWAAALAHLADRRLLVAPDDGGDGLRLHRLIGDQLRAGRRANEADDREAVVAFVDWLGAYLEHGEGGWRARVALQAFGPPLALICETLLQNGDDARLASSLGVAAYIEGSTGQLVETIRLAELQLITNTRLFNDNPGSAETARDLSVSQNNLGDFYARRGQAGDGDFALAMYQASLETRERLFKDNPGSAEAARDLSVSQSKLGDFYARRGQAGDGDAALAMYKANLDTLERLFNDNPGSAGAARDLSISQEKLGDFYALRGQAGDGDAALAMYQASLATRERLFKDNPGSAEAARDLSVSQEKLGDFYARRDQVGDGDAALAIYQASLETDERLFKDNRGSAEAARDVAVSLHRLGIIAAQFGDEAGAIGYRQRLLDLLERYEAEGRVLDPAMRAVLEQCRQQLGKLTTSVKAPNPDDVPDELVVQALADEGFCALLARLLAEQTGQKWKDLDEDQQRTIASIVLANQMAQQQQQSGGGLRVDLSALGLDQATVEAAMKAAQAEATDLDSFKIAVRKHFLAAGGNPDAIEALIQQIGDET